METQTFYQRRLLVNLSLFLGLILFTAIITILYVSSEKYFYFWDGAYYPNLTNELVAALQKSPSQAFKLFLYSLTTEYNKIFCLPLLPFVLIFGDSRLTYVMSLALVYLVPFCLVMGLLATKIFSTYPYPRQLFWLTAFLTLLMPPTWIAILRGYPDMGGAAIIGLAIFVYLKDVKLRHWWQIPLIGFLLAFAILFRRHFAYGARAFFVAMIVQGLLFFAFEFRSGYKKAFQSLIKYGLAIALVAIASFTTLVIFAPTFIKNILTTNYRLLYASYEKNPLVVLNYFINSYGELTWLLAFLGFLAIIITRKYLNSGILFTAIFGIFSLLQWILSSKQVNIHYNNHFALFIILGIVGFLISIERFFPEQPRNLILAIVGLFLISNLVFGMTNIGQFKASFRSLWAKSSPPLVRKDYDEIVRLTEYLRQIGVEKKAIFISASSRVLNESIVKEAEEKMYGQENQKLNILQTPDIDSRDFYPLRSLLQAQYVVIANPFQHHQPPQEQDLVKVVVDAFIDNWDIAKDFQPLPEQFILDKGVVVSIYQRIRPTYLATTLDTLNRIREIIQPLPGNEAGWVVISNPFKNSIWYNKHETINVYPTVKSEPTYYLYFGNLAEKIVIDGKMTSAKCIGFEGFTLDVSTINRKGDVIASQEFKYSANELIKFPLEISGKNADYLLLELKGYNQSNDKGYCSLYIKNMGISN